MARTFTFSRPNQTCLFDAHQMQARHLVGLVIDAWSLWGQAHLISLRSLVVDHQVGVVVAGYTVEHLQPFRFQEADNFEVEVAVQARADGQLMLEQLELRGPRGPFARIEAVLRPVVIGDPVSMAAAPGPLPASVCARFAPDEVVETHLKPSLRGYLEGLERSGPPLAEGRRPFTVFRHLCEIADQWSFTEIPGYASSAREALALAEGARLPVLRAGLSRPLRKLEVELRRPFFAFDEGFTETRAYAQGDGLVFVHRLRAAAGENPVHGTVVEQM